MDDFAMEMNEVMDMDLNTETEEAPEVVQTVEETALVPVEEALPVAEVEPVGEASGHGVSAGVVIGVVAGVAGVGYAAVKFGKKAVEKIKTSKLADKIREKRFERAKQTVLDNGYVVRPAELPKEEDPGTEEAKEAEENTEE